MANSIQTMTDFSVKLDEKYRKESLTAKLDSDPELVTLIGKDFKIPQMELDGLATHSRADGGTYVDGGATLTFVTKTPDYDRNRKFTVDVMDNQETADIAFGKLSGVFIKEKVVPEIDTVRFSKYADVAGTTETGAIADAEAFLAELRKATTALDEAEVYEEGRHLFATPALINSIMALQTIESREVLDAFESITKVPASRFYTDVELLDGKTAGQEKGGFGKGDDSKNINFLIVQKDANIQSLRHVAPKYIPGNVNQTADGDSYAYRVYGITDFYDNKVKGIYAHIAQ